MLSIFIDRAAEIRHFSIAANILGVLNLTWISNGEAFDFIITVFADQAQGTAGEPAPLTPLEVTDILTRDRYSFVSGAPCTTYGFQLMAMNRANVLVRSEVVMGTVPSVPDLSAVQASLRHSFTITTAGLSIIIVFSVSIYSCLFCDSCSGT